MLGLHDEADAKGLLLSAIFDPDPVIVVEEMGLYWAKAPVPDVAAPNAPVPFSPGQEQFYKPGADDIVRAVRSIL